MSYLFDAPVLRELEEFAGPGTLVALDYDGTLAPIVPQPDQAHMRESTRRLLARVARRFPVIVLTGRARGDAMRFLGGVAVLEVIGSHGSETAGSTAGRFLQRVGQWRAQMSERLRAIAGVVIEDKRYSLSVHYRHAPDPAAAQAQVERAAAGLEGARIVGGKAVLNVLPQGAPHKGTALLSACARLGCPGAVYVGDDETDEDVFALARPDQIFGIRVGEDPASAAGHFLRDQTEIDRLLEALIERSA